ncbi:hypothetical protein HC891_19015, partial [Candidatus Gracilibacteria bacterium]|nr:hypothetical protein [Candidatus Gracilibacteria bacterium]
MDQFSPTVLINQLPTPAPASDTGDWLALTRRLLRCASPAAAYDLIFAVADQGGSAFALIGYLDTPPVGPLLRLVALDAAGTAPLQRRPLATDIALVDSALMQQFAYTGVPMLVPSLDSDNSGLRALLEAFDLPTSHLGAAYAIRLACMHGSGPLVMLAWRAGAAPSQAWLAALP